MSVVSNNTTTEIVDPCDLYFLDFQTIPITTRRPIGVCLFILCICSLSFYFYVIHLILRHKLYKTHPFFLWFVSIGFGDIVTLLNYCLSFFLNCFDVYPVSKSVVIGLGHLYQFSYNVCLFHFPVMAFIRMLAIVFPIKTKTWFTVTRMLKQITFVWAAGFANTVFLQSYKSNWMFFDPGRLSFSNVCWDPDGPFKHYWDAVPPVFILSSDLLYLVCYLKLRMYESIIFM